MECVRPCAFYAYERYGIERRTVIILCYHNNLQKKKHQATVPNDLHVSCRNENNILQFQIPIL